MNKEQAKKLIRETFESRFDKEKFLKFISNLLNLKLIDIETTKKGPWQGQYIPESFRDYISKYERLAKYISGDHRIDILMVYLKKQTSIERARTMQRNFIAGYLKGNYGSDTIKDAALVAFVSPNKEDWRFSLVKIDYAFDDNGKVNEIKSPARRWSFLVGKNERSHTAQSRLVSILADDKNNPTLADLEEAFNIEKVTKEFFSKYRDLLVRTVDALDEIIEKDNIVKKDFETKNINTVDFAKKLLGQIVFLYFLQKKGWFGVKKDSEWGTGSKDFLRRLFNKEYCDYTNFFNDILEPFFYEALNTKRDNDFYPKFNCKIPFLNGGLFEPIGNYDWEHTDMTLPDSLFSNNRKTPEGDIGDGILDVFDRFNFTVKEDEPLEKEVAVDPELLGKLYEKFNAIRPDNFYEYKEALSSGKKNLEKKFNKKFGVYYTPREIVHYMCQQSLIYYLSTELEGKISKEDIEKLVKLGEHVIENEVTVLAKGKETKTYKHELPDSIKENAELIDEKLKDIKVCDPAVGSGAFPVGMMHEIVKLREILNIYLKNKKQTTYVFKRECIENSLYGVDIDPGAVEVAKLRLWLSLVVDEEDFQNIKPLPNLDYKMMQGNSLIEFITRENTVASSDYTRNKLINKIIKLKTDLFNTTSSYQKFTLRNKLKILIEKLFNYDINKKIEHLKWEKENIMSYNPLIIDKDYEKEKNSKIKQIDKEIKCLLAISKPSPKEHFEWNINFSEVFQKKNGFDVIIANPPYIGEAGHKNLMEKIRISEFGKRFAQGKMDYFHFFLQKAIHDISHGQSIISFITTNYYLTGTGASKLRKSIKEHTDILELINFNEVKIFETAHGQHNAIIILSKNKKNRDCLCIIFKEKKANIENIIFNKPKTEEAEIFRTKYVFDKNNCIVPQKDSSLIEIKNKMEKGSVYFDYKDITQGIVMPQDFVNKKHLTVLVNTAKIGEGIFVLSDKELQNLNLTSKEIEDLIRPYYTTDELHKYCGNPKNKYWIIYTTTEKIKQIDKYLNIKKHLDKFKDVITSDFAPYGLHRARDEFFFKGEKIISRRMTKEPVFTYTDFDCYVSQTFFVIKGRNEKIKNLDLKFLTGLLNSKLSFWYFYNFGKRKGEQLQIDKQPLMNFPIRFPDKDTEKTISKLVDNICNLKRKRANYSKPQQKIKQYQKQIDQLVYKLYGLTEEEIKIVEGNKHGNN